MCLIEADKGHKERERERKVEYESHYSLHNYTFCILDTFLCYVQCGFIGVVKPGKATFNILSKTQWHAATKHC